MTGRALRLCGADLARRRLFRARGLKFRNLRFGFQLSPFRGGGFAAQLIGLGEKRITLGFERGMRCAIFFNLLMLAESVIAGTGKRDDGGEKNRTNDTR